MLVADSVTAAVEVSIYLASEAISHMQQKPDFHLPLNATAILTRHIDVLQVRNGRIHILDYKSNASPFGHFFRSSENSNVLNLLCLCDLTDFEQS
jgi:hypothetical protein